MKRGSEATEVEGPARKRHRYNRGEKLMGPEQARILLDGEVKAFQFSHL